MKLTITLERGDAALGTLDLDVLRDLASRAVEDTFVETILEQMPDPYTKAGRRALFDDEDAACRDFDLAARATLRWMLRNFTIAAKRVPQLPTPDALREECTVTWPREGGEEST